MITLNEKRIKNILSFSITLNFEDVLILKFVGLELVTKVAGFKLMWLFNSYVSKT